MSEVVRIQSKGTAQATPPAIPLFAQRDAALRELAAIEAAQKEREAAPVLAAQRAEDLRKHLADIDRQQAEGTAAALVREAAWEAESAPAALQALYSELGAVADALRDVLPFIATVQQISDRHTQMIGESISASLAGAPETGNWNTGVNNARSHAAKVLQQVQGVPVTDEFALMQWIKNATNPQDRHIRVGLVLALTGKLFDLLPDDFNASAYSREQLRKNTLPKF